MDYADGGDKKRSRHHHSAPLPRRQSVNRPPFEPRRQMRHFCSRIPRLLVPLLLVPACVVGITSAVTAAVSNEDPLPLGLLAGFGTFAQGVNNEAVNRRRLRIRLGGTTDLRMTDLSRQDLRGSYLRGRMLCGAMLSKAAAQSSDLSYANLRDARLTHANFRHSRFEGADLVGAGLYRAKLDHCSFIGADLRGAILAQASLKHADLRGADLRYSDLRDTLLADCKNLDTALLGGSRYSPNTTWPPGLEPSSPDYLGRIELGSYESSDAPEIDLAESDLDEIIDLEYEQARLRPSLDQRTAGL